MLDKLMTSIQDDKWNCLYKPMQNSENKHKISLFTGINHIYTYNALPMQDILNKQKSKTWLHATCVNCLLSWLPRRRVMFAGYLQAQLYKDMT